MSRAVRLMLLASTAALAWALTEGGPASSAAAQERPPTAEELRREIQESQRRLEQIREERARLQREMAGVRARAQDVAGELRNIERQLSASRSVLAEIELQSEATQARIDEAERELGAARVEHRERQAVLARRLRTIYMRGPLHTVEVLLGADSFSDLLTRYRYLQMVALHDRSLLQTVGSLESELEGQTRELEESLAELDRLRRFQLDEVALLQRVEAERQSTLERFRTEEAQAASRLDRLEADEGRLAGLVNELEGRRGAAPAQSDPTLTDEARGTLPWPVEGEVAYRFGIERRPNGTVLRWNGLGIRAPRGAPVRAVRAGAVALAGPFEGYGPTVILSHGEGFYTLYLHLDEVGVVEGREVDEGQVVGTVGGGTALQDAYIEFQVRAPVGDGPPHAQDPLAWLGPPGR